MYVTEFDEIAWHHKRKSYQILKVSNLHKVMCRQVRCIYTFKTLYFIYILTSIITLFYIYASRIVELKHVMTQI